MINLAQSAIGIKGLGQAISSQGRSGFETNVITKLDNIESKLGNNNTPSMPVEQPPLAPVGNLGGNLGQPDPVAPEIQNIGDDSLTPVGSGINTVGGDMGPIADTSINEPYQIPQSRSFI